MAPAWRDEWGGGWMPGVAGGPTMGRARLDDQRRPLWAEFCSLDLYGLGLRWIEHHRTSGKWRTDKRLCEFYEFGYPTRHWTPEITIKARPKLRYYGLDIPGICDPLYGETTDD